MARTIVDTCDICKKQKDLKEMARISIEVSGIHIKNADRYNPMKIDICKECLEEKGFDVVGNYERAAENNKKTLEEKLLEILEDLGVSFEE